MKIRRQFKVRDGAYPVVWSDSKSAIISVEESFRLETEKLRLLEVEPAASIHSSERILFVVSSDRPSFSKRRFSSSSSCFAIELV